MQTTSSLTGRLRRPLIAVLGATALAASALTGPALAAGTAEPAGGAAQTSARAAQSTDRVAAERALTRVERLFDGRGGHRDVTLALRELWRSQEALSAEDQARAARFLARPTDPGGGITEDPAYGDAAVGSTCGPTVCVHWVETGEHAVADDGNVATIPDYVEQTLAESEHVAQTYIEAGYRPVKADGTLGGNAKPDIYLANLAPLKWYGYCTTDQPVPQGGPWDAWAFCALDNDYAEFPNNTPIENMQVTVAHEYFHAVQYSYDAFEDGWLIEATATWAEEQLHDDVDDNLQYLEHGPLGAPNAPLDWFDGGGLHQYGDWIFFQYLSEHVITEEEGGMPVIVREIWERADGAAGARDEYSLQAVEGALKARGRSFGSVFAAFADANRRPGLTYEEGAANDYPAAPDGSFTKSGQWYATKLDHLSSASGYFTPNRTSKKLKVQVDLAPTSRGSWAMVSAYPKSGGAPKWWVVSLDKDGNGSKTVPFTKKSVAAVDVTLVNASTRVSCWQSPPTPFSCQGSSPDDRQVAKVRALVLR